MATKGMNGAPERKLSVGVLVVGAVLLVAGAFGWVMQLTQGLIATSGMTNSFVWGLMIVVFAFLVGFGAGAQFVCTALYLSGNEKLQRFAPVAAVVGLSCVAAAGVAILADLGAIRNILAMVVGLNLRSPLAWDVVAMTTFLVLSLVQVIAIARTSPRVKIWAVLAGVAALALQVVEGLLFSLQTAHAWWATPIMPVDFVAVAFVSGSALLLVVAVAAKQDDAVCAWLSRFAAIAIAVHLVLALVDLVLVVSEGTPQAAGVLAVLQGNAVLYAVELTLPLLAMVLLFARGRSGSGALRLLAALLAAMGIFAHRFMLLYPAYDAPSLYVGLSGTNAVLGAYPVSTGRYLDWGTTFATASGYSPAPVECLAALMPFGVAVVAGVVLYALVKRVSATE